jgi:shikimate dehydrogenase
MPRLAVLGQPIAHSRSPAMHNAALAELGLDGEWTYEAIEVAPDDFAARVRAMPAEGFAGANVTLPHKRAALALADEAAAAANAIGAANTLSFRGERISADNTDATGFLAALDEAPAGRRALVLGAGGSARAAGWALQREGATVTFWNRTAARAAELAQELRADALDPGEGPLPAREFELIVNATTVGMASARGHGDGRDLKALHLSADSLHRGQTIVDLVYGPAETELAEAARRRGARVVDGLEVLVHQGAASLRIWTGADPPIETMRMAAHES